MTGPFYAIGWAGSALMGFSGHMALTSYRNRKRAQKAKAAVQEHLNAMQETSWVAEAAPQATKQKRDEFPIHEYVAELKDGSCMIIRSQDMNHHISTENGPLFWRFNMIGGINVAYLRDEFVEKVYASDCSVLRPAVPPPARRINAGQRNSSAEAVSADVRSNLQGDAQSQQEETQETQAPATGGTYNPRGVSAR